MRSCEYFLKVNRPPPPAWEACIGMIWGAAYLLGRRSLVPTIVAHFLNDATALPWVLFFVITSR
jgi:membrane protease YdiL (CAAX protease family)